MNSCITVVLLHEKYFRRKHWSLLGLITIQKTDEIKLTCYSTTKIMATDMISCLQLDKDTAGRIILVTEINGCDSTFIDSCVISNCIKNQTPLIFVSVHNSLYHFQNVGLKMNYNLQRHVDSGLIEFYNLGEEIVNNLLENISYDLHNLFNKLKDIILVKSVNEPVNIIIDGVSHLFDLGFSLKDVNLFCKQVFDLVRQSNSSFLLFHCNQASEDDVTHTMSNLLKHKAYTVVEVENLQSGWSTDVSGHMTVKHIGQKYENEMFTLDMKPTRYLFKLFDRGVKLLAPGTV